MKTKFSATTRIGRKQIPVVVRTLRAIEKQNGVLTPELVVAQAVNKQHPLHRYFTWDDTEAAARYRTEQARKLIQSVNVVFKDSGGVEQSIRAFVNVKPDESEVDDIVPSQGYISMDRSGRSMSYQQQVIQYAHGQLLGWKKRFGHLKEFYKVAEEIEKVKA